MIRTIPQSFRLLLLTVGIPALLTACADDITTASRQESVSASNLRMARSAHAQQAFATLRRVTAPYHDLNVAIADGFVLLHPCEERPDEGPVGTVYVHIDRLMDGIIDPASPDALIYEPSRNGRPKLVGVEFALPYGLWTQPQPPEFLGASFQPEDEFGVWALHLWVWRDNPEGMFAESHPRVSCDAE